MSDGGRGMIVFQVNEPVFKTAPLFIFGCSHADLDRYLKRRFNATVDDIDDHCCGQMLTYKVSPWRVVWTKRVPKKPEDIGCLLHEIFHLVTRICGDKDIPIHHHISTGEIGDETAAYMAEFFFVRCMEKLGRKG